MQSRPYKRSIKLSLFVLAISIFTLKCEKSQSDARIGAPASDETSVDFEEAVAINHLKETRVETADSSLVIPEGSFDSNLDLVVNIAPIKGFSRKDVVVLGGATSLQVAEKSGELHLEETQNPMLMNLRSPIRPVTEWEMVAVLIESVSDGQAPANIMKTILPRDALTIQDNDDGTMTVSFLLHETVASMAVILLEQIGEAPPGYELEVIANKPGEPETIVGATSIDLVFTGDRPTGGYVISVTSGTSNLGCLPQTATNIYNVASTETQFTVSTLEPNTTYIIKICGLQSANGRPSSPTTIKITTQAAEPQSSSSDESDTTSEETTEFATDSGTESGSDTDLDPDGDGGGSDGTSNNPPDLASVSNQSINTATKMVTINVQDVNESDLDMDGDTITYTCYFDQSQDGNVTASATNLCTHTNIDNGSGLVFSQSTGILSSWEPAASGEFEFLVIGCDDQDSCDEVIFEIDVQTPAPTNQSPSLDVVASQSIFSDETIATLDVGADGGNDLDQDGESITYECYVDTTIDSDVTADLSHQCSDGNIGNGSGFNFDTSTGVISGWTPTNPGTFEFRIIGCDPEAACDEIFFSLSVNQGRIVIGAPDFATDTATPLNASTTSYPSAALQVGSKLLVADYIQNRLLIWNNFPTSDEASADIAVGQPDLTSNTADNPALASTAAQLNTWNYGAGVHSDGTRLVLTDNFNNAIKIWNTIPTSSGEPADIVITDGGGSSSPTDGLYEPSDAIIVDDRLIVTDRRNNRILIYTPFPTSSSATPSIVVGQQNFDCGQENHKPGICSTNGVNQAGIGNSASLWSDGTKLILAAYNNNRVLIWNTIPTSSYQNADLVLGQSNFTSNGANQGGLSASTLSKPTHAAMYNGRLYVADTDNNRVLIWNTFPTTDGQAADEVFGQEDFTSNAANRSLGGPTWNSLNKPSYVQILADGRMMIADGSNKRVIIIPHP